MEADDVKMADESSQNRRSSRVPPPILNAARRGGAEEQMNEIGGVPAEQVQTMVRKTVTVSYTRTYCMILELVVLKRSLVWLLSQITALALCHNVTPVVEEDGNRILQAASPDEVALVKFSDSVGLKLEDRTVNTITLTTPLGDQERYEILNIFPFTSETKRMGIIMRNVQSGDITFYLKGAETVMKTKIQPSDWLEEEGR